MRRAVISFFLALILTASASTYSQDQQAATVNFSVLSKNTWGFVDGLKTEDVSIEEDGSKREVIRLNSDEQALSMILLIDASGSMRQYLDMIKDVAMEAILSLRPEDEVALIIFNNEPTLVRDFTKDKKPVGDEIRNISYTQLRARTFLNKAVMFAADHLQKSSNPNNRRIVILITDDLINDEDKKFTREAIRKALVDSRGILCGLIMPERGDRPTFLFEKSRGKTARYVNETGGLILPVEDKNARVKMNKMIAGFHKQYTLEYRPASVKRDNRSPKIIVKVSKEVEKREGDLIILSPRG